MAYLDSKNRRAGIQSRRFALGTNLVLFFATLILALVALRGGSVATGRFLIGMSVIHGLLAAVAGYRLSSAQRSQSAELFKS